MTITLARAAAVNRLILEADTGDNYRADIGGSRTFGLADGGC